MSIVTAVPFGIAIYKRWDAESPREREQCADVHQEAPAHSNDPPIESQGLYGQEVASMGSAFHDIMLGADATGFQTHATAERIRLAAHDDSLVVSGTRCRFIGLQVSRGESSART